MNETPTQEQSILSIEDKADKYGFDNNGVPSQANLAFIAGANEMLPIIKELKEVLANLLFQVKFPSASSVDANGQMIRKPMETIISKAETTLDKYKNIQYDTQRTNGKHL
jgi:hypothetical protein